MLQTPLSPPTDGELLAKFLSHSALSLKTAPIHLLREMVQAFSELPYENLTKIIKQASLGSAEQSRRWPREVITEHLTSGTGGTCFSLTATLLYLLRSLGWRAEPILADRHYGENTHCAVVVWTDDKPHLLDPGYLIVTPIPLTSLNDATEIETGFSQLRLAPSAGDGRRSLYTVQQGSASHRLTFKTEPADAGEFLKAWDASFDWDMMQYPLLTRIRGHGQLYLRGNRLQIRSRGSLQRQEIAPDLLVDQIASDFNLGTSIATQALSVLKTRS